MAKILIAKDLSKKFDIKPVDRYLSLRDKLVNGISFKKDVYQEFWALKDLNFEVEQGESFGIIGANGAGKSTLLKIISKITPPTKGQIELHGRVASLLEVGTGFHPELTGRENIYLNGSILGLSKKEIDHKLEEIIDFSGVENYIDNSLKFFSSGMQLRLAFAVAAHLEPEILIIDEVLAVGDSQFQKKCIGKLDEVSSSGRTVIFVSHDMASLAKLTKKAMVLKQGKMDYLGETRSAINHYLDTFSIAESNYEGKPKSESLPYIKSINVHTNLPKQLQSNGKEFQVELLLSTPVPLKGASLSFQIVDRTGRNFVHLWVFDSEQAFGRKPGEYRLNCFIPSLKLFMGNYHLKVYFTGPPGGPVYEIIDGICPFEVVMIDSPRKEFAYASNTMAYLEAAKWEINSL